MILRVPGTPVTIVSGTSAFFESAGAKPVSTSRLEMENNYAFTKSMQDKCAPFNCKGFIINPAIANGSINTDSIQNA